jgi:Domain of unknown function (DUF4388)/PilZ domain
MTMSNDKDRRESKRISYICEVECEGSGIRRLATRINDLSLTGAFIDSMTCFATGSILRLRFRVKEILIETTAEVRYCMPQMGMGVLFLNLTPDHIAALESLIDGKPLILPAATPEPPGGAKKVSDGSNPPDMLLGNFAVVSMFDVIQVVENNRLCGALVVRSPGANGEIYFNDGQIVGAQSGSSTGTSALKSFLDVAEGSFDFKRTSTKYPRRIDATSNMSLLLDLLRVTDEEATALG